MKTDKIHAKIREKRICETTKTARDTLLIKKVPVKRKSAREKIQKNCHLRLRKQKFQGETKVSR